MLSDKGISLVEVVLSVAMVGLIVLTIYNIPNSIRLNGSTQKTVLAKDITAKQVEQLRQNTYDNLINGTSIISDARMTSLPLSSGTIVISDCPVTICTGSEQVKQAVVTVSWQDDGKVKKSQLVTFIAKGGLQ